MTTRRVRRRPNAYRWWRAEVREEMREDAYELAVWRLAPVVVLVLVVGAAYGSLVEAALGIVGGLLAFAWLSGPMILGIYLVRTGRPLWGCLLVAISALQIVLLLVLG